MPFAWFSIGFGVVTSYFAGEVREVKKNVLYSQLGSTIVAGIGLSILGALALGVFGYDFLGSMTSLSFSASSSYPLTVSPYFNLFVSMLTTNPVLLWILAASYVAGFYVNAQANYLLATRSIFAWSFDRVIPARFAELDKRLNSPLYAVALVAIINVIGLVVYTLFSSTLLALESGDALGFVTVFILASIAGIAFPFAKKEFFESSPANIRVGRIPLITIAGVISLIFFSTLAYFYVSNPLYGSNIPIVYETIAIVAIVPLLIFAIAYYYRKSQGMNLMYIFDEIPPE
jgi:amino acid transporter